jgi:thioredoxin reductase (NADPH)
VAVQGKDHLESITIVNDKTHEEKKLPATALFIFIGAEPYIGWLQGMVKGFVLSGPDLMHEGQPLKGWPLDREPFFLETSIPGIFTAGDVRHSSIKRVASSAGEGAMAVHFIHRYLGLDAR